MKNRLHTQNGIPDSMDFGVDSASMVVVAHDLKNHLAGTLILAEQIITGSEIPGHRIDALAHRVLLDGKRMLRVIDQVLETAQGGIPRLPLSRSVCNLSLLLRQVVKSNWEYALSKNIRLRCPDLGSEECWGQVDEKLLRMAVDNLVNNAIKFSPIGSEAQVSLISHEQAGELFALIQVKDQGPGLTPSDQAKAFGSLQKLSAQPTSGESSTGLGLAIVRQVVVQHGGKVWIESVCGQGAIFNIDLPLNTSLP
jgi:signal transduction histidine kinase